MQKPKKNKKQKNQKGGKGEKHRQQQIETERQRQYTDSQRQAGRHRQMDGEKQSAKSIHTETDNQKDRQADGN